MGTSGFWSFYSSLVKTIPINQINNKIAFVDIILYIHKYVIGMRKSGQDIKTSNGKNITHIYALTKIIKNFTDNNILPIFVFDGKSPLIKSDSLEKRREIIELSREKCENLKKNSEYNSEEYIKYFRRSFYITNELLNDCREYIKLTGIPYVNSIGEADPQCAALDYYYTNICSGVFSEDSDILLYGAKSLLKNFNSKSKYVSILYLEDIINFLQEKSDYISLKYNIERQIFTKNNLIDFSILMGNDYCPGIRYTGINCREKLFELYVISKYNIEILKEIMDEINLKKFCFYIPDNFIKKYKDAKEIYTNSYVINPNDIDIRINKPNLIEIKKFLENIDFRNDIIFHITNSLDNLYNTFNNAIKFNINKDNDNEWIIIENKKLKHNLIY
jgi:flap endonuclease-1